jgi:hypothetical protein
MNRFFKTVLLTGLFVGTTDLVSAYITLTVKSGKFPSKMLYYIAAGALGLKPSLNVGNAAAFLGLFFHYFIAFSFTLFFFLIFPRIKILSFNKYLVGMLYAVFVNVVMGQVILPLSRLNTNPFSLSDSIIDWIVLGVLFGVPIAYNAYQYYGVDSKNQVSITTSH